MLSLISVVPSFRWARAVSADDHGVDAHIHAAHLGARGAADDIANLAHDGAAHRHQVHPVVHHNMQLDGDGGVLVVSDLDALTHGLPAQQMHQTVRLGAHRHALDAVAVGGSRTGDVGEHVAADGDLAKKKTGFYVLTMFEMDGTKLVDVERKLNITEEVMRYIIVKQD